VTPSLGAKLPKSSQTISAEFYKERKIGQPRGQPALPAQYATQPKADLKISSQFIGIKTACSQNL